MKEQAAHARQPVTHQEAQHRFVLALDRAEAELVYQVRGQTMVIYHTEVPPAFQHQGHADRLAEAALAYARERGLHVAPECRFMAAYFKRHPEVADLLQNPPLD